MIGKDGLFRMRSCDSNATALCTVAVAAHPSASQRGSAPWNPASRAYSRGIGHGHPSSKTACRRARVGSLRQLSSDRDVMEER